MRFEAILGRSVRAFWSTSYSFDLRLFDQYLLRRVAQDSVNVVALVDHDKLASVWEHLEVGESYLVRQAGRRYLLRGVRLPGGGAFHPKTYLLASRDQATLLIGSGNLTRSGIDHGHEIFATFTTQREEHLPTMRAWTQWAGHVVQSQQDGLLTERWLALRESCPWMLGSAAGSELITNQQQPIADQLIARLPADVSELHLTAPFFDRDATAVQRLIRAWSPEIVVLYLGADVKVNGPSLKSVLREAPEVRIRRFQPHVFVHAKLIGAIDTSGQGVLLSGSANLSQAALGRTDSQPGGNSEIAVLRSGTADAIRKVFSASGLELVDLSLDDLDDFDFTDDHPKLARPFTLRAASWRTDGRIQLDYTPSGSPVEIGLQYDDAADPASIQPDGSTSKPLADHNPTPVLVGLAARNGELMSNRVVVDDPAALRETLEGSRAKHSNRPAELEGLEDEPLVRLVLWAHDKFIFDPDDTPAFRRAQDAAGEDANAEDAQDFWERYAAEELQYDHRTQSYKPLTASGSAVQPVDELLRELAMLLHQAPGTTPDRMLRVLTGGSTDGEHETGSGTPWSMQARHRIRAYHLLMKWAAAVGDPRHALVASNAPVVNYETLLGLIVIAWASGALEPKQLRTLLLTLLQSFIGPAEGHGYLGRVTDDERAASVAELDPSFVEIAAGLAFVALSATGWPAEIYDWQPTLVRGVELGVVLPGKLSVLVAAHLDDHAVDYKTIDDVLANRLDWIDEPTWCTRLASELGLQSIRLERFNNPRVPLLARLNGVSDFLHDPRILTVAWKVIAFKKVKAVQVRVGDDLFTFEPGAEARTRFGSGSPQRFTTTDPADVDRLKAIEEQGGALSELFHLRRADHLAA